MLQNFKSRAALTVAALLIIRFIFLCLLNYFAQEPRMDEGEILGNIKELSISQLFGELKYNQVFPRAYLAAISLFSGQFSYTLLSLRFFPLLFMIAGFFLWIYIYRQESKTRFQLFLLILSFCGSVFMIDYAGYLKQYSCDLLTVAIFTVFIYQQKKYAEGAVLSRRLWIFSILTPFLIAFSQMSFLVAWIVAYNYLFLLKKHRDARYPFVIYVFLTVFICALVYYFDIRYSMKVGFMQEYWKNCFIDTSSVYNFSKTFTNGLQNLIVRWFLENKAAKSMASVFMPFCLVAVCRNFWSSFKTNRGKILDINSLCLVLLAELFVLGLFRMYPFTGSRVTLFIAPFIFYMIVQGIYLTRKIKIIFAPLAGFYVVFLCWASYNLFFFYLGFYK